MHPIQNVQTFYSLDAESDMPLFSTVKYSQSYILVGLPTFKTRTCWHCQPQSVKH